MRNIELRNRVRSGLMLLTGLLIFLAAGMTAALIFAVEDFSKYKAANFEGTSEIAQYINVAAIAVMLLGAAAGGALLFSKAARRPKMITVKWSKFVQSIAPDTVANPFKKIAERRILLYLGSVLLYIAVFAVVGGVFEYGFVFWLTVLAGLSLFALESVLLVFSMKPLKKRQIEMFGEIYDYKVIDGFVPDAANEFDLMNHCLCDFTEEGFFIKATPRQTLLKGAAAEPFEDFSDAFKLNYSETEIYAEASYRNFGDMMSVYIIAEIKTARKAVDALNFLYAGEGTEALNNDAEITAEDFPFFMFKLDETLYNKLKLVKVQVRDLDAILLNRTENMKAHCKSPIMGGGLNAFSP